MTKKTIDKNPLPSHVYPLGVPYQVELVDGIDTVAADEEPTWGDTTNCTRRIRINAEQDTRRRWTTLLHEHLHATLYVIGAQLAGEVEEMIVQSLEHSIEQFMRAHGAQFVKALDGQE